METRGGMECDTHDDETQKNNPPHNKFKNISDQLKEDPATQACLRAWNRSKANSAFELRKPVCARGWIAECGYSLVSNRSRRCQYCGDLNVLLHRQFDRVFFSTSSFSLELRRE
ncbi:uncharacterized protein G2W53_026317 [Senna tora]|uniref:Uncharacterized protein n=1 Tax=Senna tora TaxID=362788 RepID=A0A834TGP2_9FABA|nr:uncharacterized protein G2W53_026317 [Senna tora]